MVDVWEQRELFERFRDERLLPAMGKVLAERGLALDGPPPEPSFTDAYDLVRGR